CVPINMIHELVACESYQLGIGTWDFCVDPAYGGRPAYVKIDSLPNTTQEPPQEATEKHQEANTNWKSNI
ncbi:8643_t:CDS:2, partial [Entrophospora sp. SA101]